MEITKEMILKVAENAKIRLTEDELNEFLPQFKEVLSYFSELDKVDTKDIEIAAHPVEIKNVLREDKAKKGLTQEEALSLTEHKKDGYFKGPKAV
ncbi:MAG: Asp-tRNA(Asn)/Glu-tRNA(Gln) amidotransferase subunit GatC [Candidatus Woesearchaeota archaeon]|nr:Asp-tRNA(Asn)/Glu-tRNA(Gln) amidotransferase subunit GatC [Candidatus Woesearchaeota archaeon]